MHPPTSPITTAEQVPPHMANLARRGGPIPLRDEDRANIAVLDVGGNRAVILWAGEAGAPLLAGVRSRAQSIGYDVLDVRATTAEVVALLDVDRGHDDAVEALEQTSATRLLDQILGEAVAQRASDIHIQMRRRHADVIVRVNGELTQQRQISTAEAESVVRAAYAQADVDSRMGKPQFNPRLYQDAALTRSVSVNGRFQEVKIRWASGPVWPDTFDVSLRLLTTGQAGRVKGLGELGFQPGQVDALTTAVKKPSGVILLCGTTGAGKTTTLATLSDMWLRRYKGRRLLRTIEDPPEIEIPRARQMPVSRNERGGREEGFHQALRAAMRMDPDALVLGEVRDETTANLLQQAVQTGHKVLTTVHAGTVFAGLSRLITLGVSRENVASDGFINAIVHQTLVQQVCRYCSKPLVSVAGDIDPSLLHDVEQLLAGDLAGARVRGDGCEHCSRGVSGRQAVASILVPDAMMLDMLRLGHDAQARLHWMSGSVASHGPTQAISEIQQAGELIRAGLVCPIDADLVFGRLVESAA